VQPTVLVDRGGGGLPAAEVAAHHLRAADPELAVDDPRFGARQQPPDGPAHDVLGMLDVRQRDARGRLRHPVTLADDAAEALRDRLLELRARGRGAAADPAQ
jgi:hypothetical protein